MAKVSTAQKQDLHEQVKEVTDEVTALAEMLKGMVAGTSEDLQGAAAERLEEVARRAQALAGKAKSRTQSEIASLEAKIVEKPLQSALMAFVIGLLLGVLTRR